MKKHLKPILVEPSFAGMAGCGMNNVENSKRRRALPLGAYMGDPKFFDRLLNVRRVRDFVFITKAAEKNR